MYSAIGVEPSSTLLIAQLLQEAGLPKGVLSVVHGDKGAVDVGSREIGRAHV